jgi:hypothetical protein
MHADKETRSNSEPRRYDFGLSGRRQTAGSKACKAMLPRSMSDAATLPRRRGFVSRSASTCAASVNVCASRGSSIHNDSSTTASSIVLVPLISGATQPAGMASVAGLLPVLAPAGDCIPACNSSINADTCQHCIAIGLQESVQMRIDRASPSASTDAAHIPVTLPAQSQSLAEVAQLTAQTASPEVAQCILAATTAPMLSGSSGHRDRTQSMALVLWAPQLCICPVAGQPVLISTNSCSQGNGNAAHRDAAQEALSAGKLLNVSHPQPALPRVSEDCSTQRKPNALQMMPAVATAVAVHEGLTPDGSRASSIHGPPSGDNGKHGPPNISVPHDYVPMTQPMLQAMILQPAVLVSEREDSARVLQYPFSAFVNLHSASALDSPSVISYMPEEYSCIRPTPEQQNDPAYTLFLRGFPECVLGWPQRTRTNTRPPHRTWRHWKACLTCCLRYPRHSLKRSANPLPKHPDSHFLPPDMNAKPPKY